MPTELPRASRPENHPERSSFAQTQLDIDRQFYETFPDARRAQQHTPYDTPPHLSAPHAQQLDAYSHPQQLDAFQRQQFDAQRHLDDASQHQPYEQSQRQQHLSHSFYPSDSHEPTPFQQGDQTSLAGPSHPSHLDLIRMLPTERRNLPKQLRLGAPQNEKGLKTGLLVKTDGSLQSYERARDVVKKSKDNGKILRKYFNEHHHLHILSDTGKGDNRVTFSTSGKILAEAERQARAKEMNLSYLTMNKEKALSKAQKYEQQGNNYQSDGE
jgi:hypothetical protein